MGVLEYGIWPGSAIYLEHVGIIQTFLDLDKILVDSREDTFLFTYKNLQKQSIITSQIFRLIILMFCKSRIAPVALLIGMTEFVCECPTFPLSLT